MDKWCTGPTDDMDSAVVYTKPRKVPLSLEKSSAIEEQLVEYAGKCDAEWDGMSQYEQEWECQQSENDKTSQELVDYHHWDRVGADTPRLEKDKKTKKLCICPQDQW